MQRWGLASSIHSFLFGLKKIQTLKPIMDMRIFVFETPCCGTQVLIDPLDGLCVKHRSDRKVICVNPEMPGPGSQSSRLELDDPANLQVVLFDHLTRATPRGAVARGTKN